MNQSEDFANKPYVKLIGLGVKQTLVYHLAESDQKTLLQRLLQVMGNLADSDPTAFTSYVIPLVNSVLGKLKPENKEPELENKEDKEAIDFTLFSSEYARALRACLASEPILGV